MPVSPGAVLPRDMNPVQWSDFLRNSGIQGDRSVKSFAPTWGGFSADPSGDISYKDFGAIVALWWDSTGDLTGTSNTTSMSWSASSLPESIRPTERRVGQAVVMSAGAIRPGFFTIYDDGAVEFAVHTISGGTEIVYDSGGFANPGVNGLPAGWMILYPK